jgi:hypothetical protein
LPGNDHYNNQHELHNYHDLHEHNHGYNFHGNSSPSGFSTPPGTYATFRRGGWTRSDTSTIISTDASTTDANSDAGDMF